MPSALSHALSQTWPPFVLIAGLLLIGVVASTDRLFEAAGAILSGLPGGGPVLFASLMAMVVVVTVVLNLDTSVVFLTPVLAYAARSRGEGEGALLVGCLLLSNTGSLLLPGSNLTNLIVLGHLHLSGGQFLARMALPWIGAVVLTGGIIAVAERRSLRGNRPRPADRSDPDPDLDPDMTVAPPKAPLEASPAADATLGLGALGVMAVTALVLALRDPALPVAGVGVLLVAVRLATRRQQLDHVLEVGCSGSPWPSAPWAGRGRARPPCSPISTAWAPQWWRRWPRSWSTTSRPPPCWRHGSHPTPTPCWSASTSGPTSSSPGPWPGSSGGGRRGRPARLLRCAVPWCSACSPCPCPWPRPWACWPSPDRSDPHRRGRPPNRPPPFRDRDRDQDQLILSRSTTNTRVSLMPIPAPGDWLR